MFIGSAALRTHVAMAASTSATQQQQQAADTGAVVVYVTVPSMEVGERSST